MLLLRKEYGFHGNVALLRKEWKWNFLRKWPLGSPWRRCAFLTPSEGVWILRECGTPSEGVKLLGPQKGR